MKKYRTIGLSTYVYFAWIISIIFFLYSYTQADLNLTFSRFPFLSAAIGALQQIGFYNRPVSALWYMLLIFFMFVFYFLVCRSIAMNRYKLGDLVKLVLPFAVMGIFSYPAFSYDIFNYVFTAKTVAYYGDNPYTVIPREYWPVDPWINFMRWIHLPSAYTPFWIFISIIPYILGFGRLFLVLYIFKGMFFIWYGLVAVGMFFILKKIDPENVIAKLAIFLLHPVVLIESIISPHNDIVMMAFAIGAMALMLYRKTVASFLLLALSVALKLMTVFLYPVAFMRWKAKPTLVIMICAMAIGFYKKEFLPWYFLWVAPFMAISAEWKQVVIPLQCLSIGLAFSYAPYLYFGDYTPHMKSLRLSIILLSIVCGTVFLSATYFASYVRKSKTD